MNALLARYVRPDAWRAADQIVASSEGRVEASGSLDALVGESAAMAALWTAAGGSAFRARSE